MRERKRENVRNWHTHNTASSDWLEKKMYREFGDIEYFCFRSIISVERKLRALESTSCHMRT